MNEFQLIAHLTQALPAGPGVVVGPGDDCAVLDLGVPGKYFLFKTDAVVEGVHFTGETPPEKIGRKALARALSDVAAMAGTPIAALVTLGLPATFDTARVVAIYDGLNELARTHGVAIVGGETTTNPGGVLISIALLASAVPGQIPLRSGAKVGDAIFVTGTLGGSLTGRHLEFEPRLAEARWLVEHAAIHAMIDVSDGLAGDLRHILKGSGVGAALLKTAIPVSAAAKACARSGTNAKPALLAALTDGEDFELLFTVAAREAVRLTDGWKQAFPHTKLTCIGKIVAGSDLVLNDKYGSQTFNGDGYVHFK
jgi:thiamine-monophosphate kinase